MRVGIYTLGCKVNQYDTQAMLELFRAAGYEVVPFHGEADVYVVNTCTVTAESDRKARQFIRRAIAKNPEAVVVVTGCLAQTSAEMIAAIDGVDAVVGSVGTVVGSVMGAVVGTVVSGVCFPPQAARPRTRITAARSARIFFIMRSSLSKNYCQPL